MGNEQSATSSASKSKKRQVAPAEGSESKYKGIPLDTKVPKLTPEEEKQRAKMVERYKRKQDRAERRRRREEERRRLEEEIRKRQEDPTYHKRQKKKNGPNGGPDIDIDAILDSISDSTVTTARTDLTTQTYASSGVVYGHGHYEEYHSNVEATQSEKLGFQVVPSRSMSGLSLYSLGTSTTGSPTGRRPPNERRARRRRIQEHHQQQQEDLLHQWEIGSDISSSSAGSTGKDSRDDDHDDHYWDDKKTSSEAQKKESTRRKKWTERDVEENVVMSGFFATAPDYGYTPTSPTPTQGENGVRDAAAVPSNSHTLNKGEAEEKIGKETPPAATTVPPHPPSKQTESSSTTTKTSTKPPAKLPASLRVGGKLKHMDPTAT